MIVTIVVPTYNRASILNDTLNSVINQTYTAWECLIIDDESTDSTFELVKQISAKDNRFKYFKRPNNVLKGANACRNIGLDNAKGDFIVWLDSDDYIFPEFLEYQLKELNESKANYSICKCEWLTIEGKKFEGFHGGGLESNDRINDYIRFQTFWPIHSVMYSSVFLRGHNLCFDESLQQSQEYDFHVKVMQVDSKYQILPRVLVRVIANEDSISYSKTNAFAKAYSSLRVRYGFLQNKNLKLNHITCVFLLHDMHRIFMQQSVQKNRRASLFAAYYYLKGHFCRKEIFKKYFIKHLLSVLIVSIVYNVFNKGYTFIKKSNTFNYS